MEVLNSLKELKVKRVSDIAYENGKIIGIVDIYNGPGISYELNIPLVDLFIARYKGIASFYFKESVKTLFDEEFFKVNAKVLLDSFKCVDESFANSLEIFNYCFENKLYNYLFQTSTFDNLLYDKIRDLDLGDPLVKEIDAVANSIIADADRNFCDLYGYSSVLAVLTLRNKNIDFLDEFRIEALKKIPEGALEECYDLLYEKCLKDGYLLSFLNNKKSFFDYVLKKKNAVLLSQFEPEFITDDVVAEYKEDFKKCITELILFPRGLIGQEFVGEFLFENKMYDKFIKNGYVPKLDYFNNEEFYNYFIKRSIIGNASKSREIMQYCLDRKEYKFVFTHFDAQLFDVEIVKKYPEIFTCDDADVLKRSVAFYYDTLEYFLNKDDVFETPVEFFSDESLALAMKYYPEKMYALIMENIEFFSENLDAFIFLLERKKYKEAGMFKNIIFDDELLQKYGDGILDYLDSTNSYSRLYNNFMLLEYALKNGRASLVQYFGNPFITDKRLHKYAKEILENLPDRSFDKLNSDFLFEKAIEYGMYDLAITYHYITDDMIEKYFDKILLGIKIRDYIPSDLIENEKFVTKCIENNVEGLFNFIPSVYITDDFLDEHKDEVLEFLNGDISSSAFRLSKAVFRFVVRNKLFTLLDRLSSGSCDYDFLLENIDLISKNIGGVIPKCLLNSAVFLKYSIDNNKLEYVMNFYNDSYNSLDEKYLSKLTRQLKRPFGEYIGLSYNLLNYMLEHDDFRFIDEFNPVVFGDSYKPVMGVREDVDFVFSNEITHGKKILSKYFSKIYKYSLISGVPKPLKCNRIFLGILLDKKKYELVDQFHIDAWPSFITGDDYQKIIDYIYEYNKGRVPVLLITNEKLRKLFFDNKQEDLFMQCVFNANSEEMMVRYAKKLNYSYDVFKSKVDYLMTRNDELFNTILPRMFESRMEVIGFNHLEKIMLYPELQSKLINMDDTQLKVMSRVFDLLDSDKYDFTGVIVSVIDNLFLYDSLIKSIDFDSISKEEFSKLLTVISRKDNLFGIEKYEDLKTSNYKKLKDSYFADVTKRIKANDISLEEIKVALLQKKFGLSIKQTEFLVERYCHDLDSLAVIKSIRKYYTILNEINRIYTSNDLVLLKYLYINSKTIENDFIASISLESAIRQSFADIYSNSLYKLKDEHKLANCLELKDTNSELYDKLNDLTYNGKKIPVYVMDGDFRLQIHALGAYSEWKKPNDFKQDWERPKIAYHGICTSYIANNQIANARAKHPILGFDNYSSNSLLCAGNYDLFSDDAISRYDTSMYLPYKFYLPDEMINNTRHTHNEMVLERRSNVKGASYKRLPNYLVMLIDDFNNIDNFSGDLWEEYCQAAHDYDVPIVIVDRLKYAKSELAKIMDLEASFNSTYDDSLLNQMILQFSNNMIGCVCFDQNDVREYHKIFNKGEFTNLVDRLFNSIMSIVDEEKKIMCLKALYDALEVERKKDSDVPNIDKIVVALSEFGIVINSEYKDEVNTFGLEHIINEYYYNSPEDVQKRIEEDVNNDVDLKTIVNNINIGNYERRFKM